LYSPNVAGASPVVADPLLERRRHHLLDLALLHEHLLSAARSLLELLVLALHPVELARLLGGEIALLLLGLVDQGTELGMQVSTLLMQTTNVVPTHSVLFLL
jgi:hypothetical protein